MVKKTKEPWMTAEQMLCLFNSFDIDVFPWRDAVELFEYRAKIRAAHASLLGNIVQCEGRGNVFVNVVEGRFHTNQLFRL